MNKHDIDKNYVSPYDEFLFHFDQTHQKSLSQIEEIKKYKRIFYLRDHVTNDVEEKKSRK